MTNNENKANKLIEGLQELLMDENSSNLSDFQEVSNNFMIGYSRFMKLGMPQQTIGLAMLGATINVYAMFGKSDELPQLFRVLADKIESDALEH